MPEPTAKDQGPWDDLQPILDQELSRLPDKYRVLIVLCDLEGKTRKEVARQLGCPEGTVAGRLARARTMLAKRLWRHGLMLSGGLLGVVLPQSLASACVPPSVVVSTIKAASLFAAGQGAAAGVISVQVASLTEGVLKAMLLKKLTTAVAGLLVLGLLAVGVAMVGQAAPPDKPVSAENPPPLPKAKPADPTKPAKKTRSMTGTIHGLSETTFNLENVDGTTAFGGRGLGISGLRVHKDTKVTLAGKPAQLKDLVNGMHVVLHHEDVDYGALTLIEADHMEYNYDVKAVDAEKKTLTLTVAGAASPVFDLTVKEDAKLAGAGKPAKLADIKPGARVAVKLDNTGRAATSVRVLREFE